MHKIQKNKALKLNQKMKKSQKNPILKEINKIISCFFKKNLERSNYYRNRS